MCALGKVTASLTGYLVREPLLDRADGIDNTSATYYVVPVAHRKAQIKKLGRKPEPVALRFVSWGQQAEKDARHLRRGSLVTIQFSIDHVCFEIGGLNRFDFKFTVESTHYLDGAHTQRPAIDGMPKSLRRRA